MKAAEDILRYIEDQFVVWHRPAPWNKDSADTTMWPVPCALEQYNWYVPIDASSASIIRTFAAMYKAGRGELYLAKAKALGATATRMQEADGFINTWWIRGVERNDDRYHTWVNCMLATAQAFDNLAQAEQEEKTKGEK